MLKLREAPDDSSLHFVRRRANVPFLLVKFQKLALYSLVEVAEICSADRVPDGDEHVSTGFC